MPQLQHKQTGDVVYLEGQDAIRAVQSGEYEALPGEAVPLISQSGETLGVRPEQLGEVSQYQPGLQGADPMDVADAEAANERAAILEREYGGTGGDVRALGEGVLSGLSLGGYDVLADWLGLDTEKYAQANPNFRLAGEATGIIGGTIASGGMEGALGSVLEKTPAALVSKGSMALGEKVAGAGLKGVIAGQAAEGAAYAAAQTTSQMLVDDDPLTAEAAVAEVARNSLFGAAIGGGTAAVFGGLGKLGNKIVGGLDESSPMLNLKGKPAKELFHNTSKAINEADLSVQHAVEVAERGLGSTKLTAEETQHWTRLNADVSAFGALEKQVDELAKVSVRPPSGIGAFNEGLETMHADLTQLLGHGYRGTPLGLEFDEAGDRLFGALAKGEREGILAAMPGYIKQVKKVARGLGVDIKEDLKGFLEFETKLKAPPEIGLTDEVQTAFKRFKLAKGAFDEAGGLSPEAVQRLVVESTEAGARRATRQMTEYVRSAKELADMVGSPASRIADEALEGLEDSLMGMRVPKNLVEPALVEGMRSAQTELRGALGAEGTITGAHLSKLAELPTAELAPKLRSVDKFFKQAHEFADATSDNLLKSRLTAIEGYIGDATKSALKNAQLDRMTKEALGMILGAEILEYSGFEGPIDDILQLAALAKLAGRAAATKSKAGPGGLLRRMMARAGSRAAPAMARSAGIGGGGVLGSSATGMVMAGGYSAGTWLHDAIRGQAGAAGLAGKVRSTIGHMLENAGKSKAPRAGALTTAWLTRSSFDFGDRTTKVQPTDLRSAYKARSEELARMAAAPMTAQAVIHEQVRPLRLVSESLADRIEVQSMQIPEWLYEKMPKDPGTMHTLGVSRWQPSEVDILEWAEYGKGALYPLETIEGALNGDISPQAAESLRTLWPEHFRALQVEIFKRAPELAESLSYDQQVRLSILTDVPIDSTMSPEFRRFMLDQEAARQAEQENSMAKPSTSSTSSSPEADSEFSPAQKLLR